MRFTVFLIGLIFSSGRAVDFHHEDRTEKYFYDEDGTWECVSGHEKTNNGTCIDIDECETPGTCSQICANEEGSFTCSCVDGYILDPNDHTRCKAENNVTFLLRTNNHILKLFPSEILYVTTAVSVHQTKLDYSNRAGFIFWNEHSKIFKARISGNSNVTELHNDNNVSSLTVDWIYEHIYWVNNFGRTIQLSNFEGQMKKTLIKELSYQLTTLIEIAIDPLRGWLFVAIWDTSVIERIGTDGSCRQKIITHAGLPRALTLDFIQTRIYWFEITGRIFSCNYDGLQLQILRKCDKHPMVLSATTFEDWLYFVDYEGRIKMQEKFKNETLNCGNNTMYYHLDQVPDKIKYIKAYHPLIQPNGINFCAPNNGNCSHLCLPAPQFNSTSPKISCSCPDGFELLSNGRTCVKEDSYSKTDTPEHVNSSTDSINAATRHDTVSIGSYPKINIPEHFNSSTDSINAVTRNDIVPTLSSTDSYSATNTPRNTKVTIHSIIADNITIGPAIQGHSTTIPSHNPTTSISIFTIVVIVTFAIFVISAILLIIRRRVRHSGTMDFADPSYKPKNEDFFSLERN